MEHLIQRAKVHESPQPAPDGNPRHHDSETIYWGVVCKTCKQIVAFDVAPYASFGPEAASTKPGAIRCAQGHNHIYFPRDFQFIPSTDVVSAEVMQQTRTTYRAVNPETFIHSNERAQPATPTTASVQPKVKKTNPAQPSADPRRKTAQTAAKSRWSEWARRKLI